jgi:hypothetical protein
VPCLTTDIIALAKNRVGTGVELRQEQRTVASVSSTINYSNCAGST